MGVGEDGKGGRAQEPTREEVNFNKDLAYAKCHNKTPYFIQLKHTKNKNRKAKLSLTTMLNEISQPHKSDTA